MREFGKGSEGCLGWVSRSRKRRKAIERGEAGVQLYTLHLHRYPLYGTHIITRRAEQSGD